MIRSITKQKSEEEIDRLLDGLNRIFIVGCGTCVTLTQTGGEAQVESMKEALSNKGKLITGQTVVPVACDNLTGEILEDFGSQIEQADAMLIMTCAYGVQTMANQLKKMVVPALDTLFIGKETSLGQFNETCTQCGTCVLGETGGICPVTSCHKGLVNGPCGGTNNGKCEIDDAKDCAWTMIYNRLKDLGRLEAMRKYQQPRNHQGEPSPGKFNVPVMENGL
ncbi:MAG: methylenetetrahydrofolate reductase C-terminal domain-containing protein [Deltaproteobacteria bacterium]|nr:methylenetetrahydrofolate reductase C-terminal domain-containing protein [Deltaproteobacteria bacterium]MBW2051849.1 methylenetetrahydrofolate reductase C-terminal domain-containing protein [Deltaproteobacteria bacterium]MBW2140790.1 methylenetetrahydrofolate reductase C-terminal domain-containing protein [Deltaproteobacteria bacterium]MBW2324346.1 methylenetetrahydrofolate reductase C-terminal domain-containing protein [Deltaproteobacteria bacterium]